MKKITFNFEKNDCVGDSVAKHNYNALTLDSRLCNLSSTFFFIEDNYKKYFDDYKSYIPTLTSAYNEYNNNSIFRYKLCDATFKVLSSYWNKHQFTVQLNTNISVSYSSVLVGNYIASDFITLYDACYNYLTNKFPASSFMQPTTAHVIGFYYTSIQPNVNSHVVVNSSPFDFSESERIMNVNFSKQSMNLSGINIYSFTNLSKNNWALTKVFPELPKGYSISYIQK